MEQEKSQAKQLKEKLFMSKKGGMLKVSAEEVANADAFCEGYKTFLDNAKTERDAVKYSVKMAEENGITNLEIIDHDAMMIKEPHINPAVRFGLYNPNTGVMNPF